jgi:2-dehydropantoate 2-reductase
MSFENPRIVVAGAGAMGGLFGGLLAENGLDVTLLDTSQEHIDAIRGAGLRIVGVGGDRTVPVRATTAGNEIRAADIVLFQCKALANEAAARSVKHLISGGAVAISFQNGLGNEETLARILGEDNVIGGLTAQAALLEGPGVVRNFGSLPTYIGEMKGGLSNRTLAIAKAFTAHGLATAASEDIKREKWKKLLGNVALGAISALTDLRSFEIMRVPELQEIVFRMVDEAAAVAKAEGIVLDIKEAREVLLKLVDVSGGGTGTSKSSMREDIIRRRRTEVDAIQGAVARLGRKHELPTPTIDAMVALVKGVQSTYLDQ